MRFPAVWFRAIFPGDVGAFPMASRLMGKELTGLTQPRPRRASRTSGFTMIELMVAVGVLLVSVMGAYSSQITSLNLMHTSRETNTAMADLQAAMEQALLLRAEEIPVPGSDFEADTPIDGIESSLREQSIVPTYPGYVTGSTKVPNPLPIVLTANWKDPQGRSRSLRLASMKTR